MEGFLEHTAALAKDNKNLQGDLVCLKAALLWFGCLGKDGHAYCGPRLVPVNTTLGLCSLLLLPSEPTTRKLQGSSVISPMQQVQNAAAHTTLKAPHHQYCTPLLQQIHWLPISEWIKYKTAHLSYSYSIGSQFLNESNTELLLMCYNPITGAAPCMFLSSCTFTVLPVLSAFHQTHARSNYNA